LYVGFDRFRRKETGTKSAQQTPALRVVHGVSALAIVLVFLGLHLSNHLVGLAGPDADEGANLQAD